MITILLFSLVSLAIGVLIGRSFKKYDGECLIEVTDEGKKVYSLELNDDVERIDGRKDIRFKVGSIQKEESQV